MPVKIFETNEDVNEYTQEELEETFVVCAPETDPLYIPDNVRAKCYLCDAKLQHHKNAPKGHKICIECYQDKVEEEGEESITHMVSKEAVQLAFDWAKKKGTQ